jgi:hypothetical protein
MSINPFKPWVVLIAVLLWNVPGLCVLITKGEGAAVLVLAGTSFLGAIVARLVIWVPWLQRTVLAANAAPSVARTWLEKISNGLFIIVLACGAVYWFLLI